MEHQLSLFPTNESSESAVLFPSRESNALDEMFSANHRFRNSPEYMDLLRFISRFPNYSPFNGLLLFMQNPDITDVATAGTWLRRFHRGIKYDARPLVILAPMSPVRFLFDISDTEPDQKLGDTIPKNRRLREVSDDILEQTLHNAALSGVVVREVQLAPQTPSDLIAVNSETEGACEGLGIEPGSHTDYLILLNETHTLSSRYAGLVYELARVFCGHFGINANAWWPNRKDIPSAIKDIEAESVAFLVYNRLNPGKSAPGYLSEYRNQNLQMPIVGLAAILNTTSYIEEMGKSRWKKPRRKGRG